MRMPRIIIRMIKAIRVKEVNIIITIILKIMRMVRMIMRMIKAMRVI